MFTPAAKGAGYFPTANRYGALNSPGTVSLHPIMFSGVTHVARPLGEGGRAAQRSRD